MFFDVTYIYIVLPAVILAMIASSSVNSTFRRYSKQQSSTRITGAQAAQRVLSANGVRDVRIEMVAGNLTDHYDPRTNTIRLSQSVYNSSSTAAIGVASHEAGHAVQYAVGYGPIKLRAAIIPITNIGSKLATSELFINIAYVGILCFALSTVFQLVTLPVEFNASRRALETIESTNMLWGDELAGARRVLRAAAMTYVAALAVSLAQLLRFLLLVNRNRDR